ncbi:MAG: hypothetical protein MUE47_02560, partial [Acidobacteria bacterium]|nr:hypothetical protein [Acidobacteriota bacterium]
MRPAEAAVRPAIALLAGSILAFEIVLLRIFSFTIWHHFAFMVISVALLGVAVSGVVLQRLPRASDPAARRAAQYALAFAALALVAVALIGRLPLDPTRLGDGAGPWLHLFGYYLVLLLPLTAAGLAIGTLLKGFAANAPAVYGSDLLGAAAGAVAVMALLEPLGAEAVVLLVAAVACLGAALLNAGNPGSAGSPLRAAVPALGAASALLAAIPFAPALLDIRPSEGKTLGWLLARPPGAQAPRVTATRWNPLARVDVVENTSPVTWTTNSRAPVPHPGEIRMLLDADAATPILEFGEIPPSEMTLLDWTLGSAAYQLLEPKRVLIIGAGGGVDVLTALRHGATTVDAVEINGAVIEFARGLLAARGGRPFEQPGVTLHHAEGRAFVRRSNATY